ncbi:MAG: transporter, partial [Planctomycetota bacterium]
THYRQIQAAAAQWAAAEKEVGARMATLKEGRGDTNVVLQSQQRQADAEIAYYRAVGEYNKSLNYVDYLKGTLLVNSGVTLSEGPWVDKAYQDALERARERSAGMELQYGVTRPAVVRRGPVRDANHPISQANDGTIGSHAAPQSSMPEDDIHMPQVEPLMAPGYSDEGIFSGGLDEVQDIQRPLSDELGDSTREVLEVDRPRSASDRSEIDLAFPQERQLDTPMGSGTLPAPRPAPSTPSLEDLPSEASEPAVRQMSYEWQGKATSGTPARNRVERSQRAPRAVLDTEPKPVRRVPLPR